MEFSRKNLATLREIKLKARQEANFEINFASPTLDQDLETLAEMEVTDELLQMILSILPEQDEAQNVLEPQNEARLRYRGQPVLKAPTPELDGGWAANASNKTPRLRYRGQVVEA